MRDRARFGWAPWSSPARTSFVRTGALTELHRRWGWIVLLGPRQPGQGAPTIPRDQLDLEEEMRQAWDDYVEKRNAYLLAAGFPKPA
jgi:hypothetical protein